jgi:hypothetical protein
MYQALPQYYDPSNQFGNPPSAFAGEAESGPVMALTRIARPCNYVMWLPLCPAVHQSVSVIPAAGNWPPPHSANFQQHRPPPEARPPVAFQGVGAEPPAAQSRSRSSSGPRPDPADEVWQPPSHLQRIDVPVPEAASYTLFFPIELSNKDYLRRVFDIVAMGIQGTVRRMIGKHGQRIGPIGSQKKKSGHAEYDFSKTCDLYYLTKHIADDASAPVYARGLQPFHAPSKCCASVPAAYRSTPCARIIPVFHAYPLQNSEPISVSSWKRAKR